jgi:C4-dicarboxylate-specific signal transduction histidine kinase
MFLPCLPLISTCLNWVVPIIKHSANTRIGCINDKGQLDIIKTKQGVEMAKTEQDYKNLYLMERDQRIAAQQHVLDKSQVLIAINNELQKKVRDLEQHQQWLIQSEKMATLGTLCAGVAHEINNPLAYVVSNVEVLQHSSEGRVALLNQIDLFLKGDLHADDLKSRLIKIDQRHSISAMSDDLPDLLNDTAEGLKRIKHIVRSLLNFAHPGSKDKQDVDIVDAAKNALKLLANQLKRCDVTTHFSDTPMLKCHVDSINQIFVNLIMNAYQACSLNASKAWLIDIYVYATSTHIIIEVKDNGCGMSSDTKAKIYDPFYTTKDVGKGTGMGMTLVYAMVHEHSGTIEINSELNEGALIRCLLPLNM